ncbi:glycosyltransferase family 2 protein [Natronomonas salina]|uniref:glycosyltransferase n=1 Tax=Natronomonas salina TaxID=1710540 RepID=UPI0015B38322|nr:glycosyltransferase family 2 protein [Natronomonas salina]QLD90252.1 glycosyltransferase family 2 protein [Natronomonas salina]
MTGYLTRAAEYGGYCTATVGLLAFGFVTGQNVQSVTLDLLVATVRIVLLEAVSSAIGFAVFGTVTGLLLLREVRTEPEEPSHEGPPVTAIVPVYRDANVLANSVESLAAAAYEDLRVVVVGEHDDAASRREALRLADEYDRVEWLENGYAGSKAGAINYAVERAETDHFVVFDADEVVDEAFVSAAMERLVGDYEVFQGRRVPQPTGPIETVAYCERVLFQAGYKLVELIGFRNCRSSSTAFTREAFETVGGYDDVLTEDLDFSHKIYRAGVPVARARYRTNEMEAPHTLRDLWGQRKRWRIGQVEVLHRTLRELVRSPRNPRAYVSTIRIVSSLLGSIFLLTLVSKFVLLLLLDLELFNLLPLAAILGTVAAVAAVDRRNGDIDGLSVSWFATPLVYPFFGLMTIKSVLEYLFSWEGEWYHVEKLGQ